MKPLKNVKNSNSLSSNRFLSKIKSKVIKINLFRKNNSKKFGKFRFSNYISQFSQNIYFFSCRIFYKNRYSLHIEALSRNVMKESYLRLRQSFYSYILELILVIRPKRLYSKNDLL